MQPENRYYRSIRLVRKTTTDVDEARGHQLYAANLLSGRVRGQFTALQPLHIGTGLLVPPEQAGIQSDVPLVKSFHQIDGRLTIPGSSLKGPIRSLVEAMTYSCVSKTREFWSRSEKEDYGECTYNSRQRRGSICRACQMFGAMGYEGHIYLNDAPQISGSTGAHFIPAQYQPTGHKERRYYPHSLQDPNEPQWPLEVALPGSVFHLDLQFQNLSAGELGLLLLALGQGTPPLCLKLGAGKNSGLGGVHFEELVVEQLDPAALYNAYSSETAWRAVDREDCLKKAVGLLRSDNVLAQLAADLGCVHLDR